MAEKWQYLDAHLRLRLAFLDPRLFEEFFLHFLRASISLTINRYGQKITRRVISADLYAAGSGRDQKGIDLRVEVEGGEIWGFQCKRRHKWTPANTRTAVQDATKLPAQHYFLVVACDPHEGVQDEMAKHPNWAFWNLSTICAEFRLQVKPSDHAKILTFLPPDELKRFVPFNTESLISPEAYFARFLGADKLFRHDWKLVGREKELGALLDFLNGKKVVQMVSARGGEGKSRLLWELCQTLSRELPGIEILFLNPHRTDNEFPFALLGNSTQRIIVVDDAHRTEQVPPQLLAAVFQDAKQRNTKLILGTRPQGVEALGHKLYETGLANELASQISLAPLKKSQIKSLAAASLGKDLAEHASNLANLTADSPFLTVIAGELLRQHRLKWGQWSNNADFRQHVFREFEHKNFELIPAPDQKVAKGLLRLLALLAPVSLEPDFYKSAVRCLSCSEFELESCLSGLRQSELIAGRDDGLRVIPDLFADFLVYDACYEPAHKMPGFVRQVFLEFSNRSSALLRNLSEATWIARTNNVSGHELLKPLVNHEYLRFEASDYYARAEILQNWSHFSIYLPAESLDLAKLAIGIKLVSTDSNKARIPIKFPKFMESGDYISQQLTALLKPVAKYHEEYRHRALDFLWELGLVRNGERNQDHAWEAIAEVIKFEPAKPVEITLDALNWLENQLKSPSGLKPLESRKPTLRLLLATCFNRIVEWTRWEGRTVHICKQAVHIESTQPVRNRAFMILSWIIENGSRLAVLDALSALSSAIERITLRDYQNEAEIPKLTKAWQSERLKALGLYEKAVKRHPNFVVRYEILQTLQQDLAYERDLAFATEARKVLTSIPRDLALETTVALMSHGAYYEFAEEMPVPRTSEEHDKVRDLWSKRVREIASGLAMRHPDPLSLHDFLKHIMDELLLAGYHPMPIMLFSALAVAAPEQSIGLAGEIIGAGVDTPLSHAWPALLDNNPLADDAKQIELFRMATRTTLAEVGSAVIRALAWKARQEQPLSDEARMLLLEIASKATQTEASNLLELVAWCSDINQSLAAQILEVLPIQRVAPKALEQVLQALAPFQDRTTPLPLEVIRSTVMRLIDVPDLDILHHSREWDMLIKQHSRLVFDLLLARIDRADAVDLPKAPEDYRAVPFNFGGRLNMPNLVNEPDYPEICGKLWGQIMNIKSPQHHCWELLFQAVVLCNPVFWLDRMQREVESAASEEILKMFTVLLRTEGSLLIFRFPELTRTFLLRARNLGGQELFLEIRSNLYTGCGPQTRSYTNGTLDKGLDYVEAEAAKAAEIHADDELLGPFYRWIVEIEQKNRLMNKMVAESQMETLD